MTTASESAVFDPAWELASDADVAPELERRLRAQLEWANERSPFYRQKFADAGVDVGRIALDDLAELPFTVKGDVHRNQAEEPPLGAHACAGWDEISRIHASSGTTGAPTLTGLTKRDRAMWSQTIARALWSIGARPGSRAWVQSSLGWWISGLTFVEALQHLGAAVLPSGAMEPARTFSVLQRTGVDFAISTPSFIKYLAGFASQQLDLDVRTLGLKSIGVGGEPGAGLPHVRRQMEETWGCKVYDTMGTADFSTLVWSECEAQDGMHFFGQGFILPEIVDANDRPVPIEPGATGELICTAIWRECTPMIRYRTGDVVEVAGTGPCSCGRHSMRIRCVGRTDDMLICNGVNVYPSAVADIVAALRPRTTGQLEIVVGPGTSVAPPMPITVEAAAGADDPSLKAELEERIRKELIFRADVTLVPAGELAATGGMKSALVRRTTD
jgi:phenylacetate-CoA ligase